jgi:Holliday junction resolvase RusA-like endonuclease
MARVYDPGTAEGWKGQIADAAKEHIPETPVDLPVCLSIDFLMPRPKRHFNSKGLKPDAPDSFTQKPDADNLAKAVMDALTVLGMWKDDAQVFSLKITKRFSVKTGAQVTIEF